jgi:pantoate--beta-alanine ligase
MDTATPMRPPDILHSVDALRAEVGAWTRAGQRVALVPTMGALHAGHVSLVELAHRHADRVLVSIFVNPAQFAPNEDFSAYPRTWDADIAKLTEAGTDAVYHPTPDSIYPEGFCTTVKLVGPATAGLEDRFRPTHFDGVATVVAKLLTRAAPHVAIFGEKDFQQLAVIRRMASDLDLPVEIVGAPTIRDADGLALSSRNVYLSEAERATAPLLHRVMRDSAEALRGGAEVEAVLGEGRRRIMAAGFQLDYLELRDSVSLAPLARYGETPARLLVAARIGTTRLIDNIAA